MHKKIIGAIVAAVVIYVLYRIGDAQESGLLRDIVSYVKEQIITVRDLLSEATFRM
jgi:hypothetical protein